MLTKVCIKCGRELELNSTNFNKRKDSKDGFRNDCKNCKGETRKFYYEENREKILLTNKEYQENNTEKIRVQRKQYREENKELIKQKRRSLRLEKDKENVKKYWERNKNRLIIQNKNWKKENADRVKQYKLANREHERELARKRYRTEEGRKKAQMKHNAYKAKKNSLLNDFTLKEWNECLSHFNKQCAYCGSKTEKLEQEHYIPVTKYGAYTKSNILPACRTCNASKSNRDFYEWYLEQSFYSKEREMKILTYLGRKISNDSLQVYGQRN